MKIKTRIIGLVGSLTCIGLAITVTSTVLVSKSNKMSDDIYKVRLISVNRLIEADRDAYQSNLALTHLLNAAGSDRELPPARRGELKKDVMDNLSQVNERYTQFSKLMTGEPAGIQSKVESFFPAYQAWKNSTDLLLTRAEKRESIATLDQDMKTYDRLFGTMRDIMDELTEYSLQVAEQNHTNITGFGQWLNSFYLVFLLFLVLVSGYAIYSVVKHILQPIDRLSHQAKDLATGSGDLTLRLPCEGNDEMATMAEHFNTFVAKVHEIIKDIAGTAGSVQESAATTLAMSVQLATAAGEAKEMAGNSDTAVSEVSKNVNAVAAATEQSSVNMGTVAAAIEEISANVNTMAKGAEDMSEHVSSVSAAMEEMSTSLTDVAQNCQRSAQASGESNSRTKDAMAQINRLNESAKRIGKVVELIEDIAEQTNLLALNATIEAASAGEAGKGFAVVANEVKELAAQTAKATEEIAEHVTSMQKDTNEAVDMIGNVTQLSEQLNQLTSSIASTVEEQSATTNDISENTTSGAQAALGISAGIQQISQGITDMSQGSSEISAALKEMAQSTGYAATGATTASGHVSTAVASINTIADNATTLDHEANTLASAAEHLTGLVKRFRY